MLALAAKNRGGSHQVAASRTQQFASRCGKCGARRVDRQIGLEATPDEWVAKLVDVFREVRRVLRDDGIVWLNVGDSYATAPKGNPGALSAGLTNNGRNAANANRHRTRSTVVGEGVKPKDLLGTPWLLAFALRADGWYLRSEIVWAKPNPMPESVRDRPTSAHEKLFLLSKRPRYFYDADSIREPLADKTFTTFGTKHRPQGNDALGNVKSDNWGSSVAERQPRRNADGSIAGANRRNVWTIATQPYPEAHFATFPTKLVEPCVLAGSSPRACGECGAPWKRVTEMSYTKDRPSGGKTSRIERGNKVHDDGFGSWGTFGTNLRKHVETKGWQPSCDHEDDSGRCVVLDPFAGSGTVGVVALRHDRSFIGIELNAAYCELARRRIADDAPLLNERNVR